MPPFSAPKRKGWEPPVPQGQRYRAGAGSSVQHCQSPWDLASPSPAIGCLIISIPVRPGLALGRDLVFQTEEEKPEQLGSLGQRGHQAESGASTAAARQEPHGQRDQCRPRGPACRALLSPQVRRGHSGSSAAPHAQTVSSAAASSEEARACCSHRRGRPVPGHQESTGTSRFHQEGSASWPGTHGTLHPTLLQNKAYIEQSRQSQFQSEFTETTHHFDV